MTTKKEARWLSDKATFVNPEFRSYVNKNFGGYPEKLSKTGLTFFRVKQENYKKYLKEQNIETVEIKEPYVIPERIKKLLESGKLWDKIVLDELDKKHIGDIETKEIIFLCCIGRLLRKKNSYSFNNIVLSVSSSGKDHLVSNILKLFPREDYEIFGRTTSKTFNYLHNLEDEPDHTYNGKIVYLKEITENILNNEVMKEFTSSEEDINEVPIPRPTTKFRSAGVDMLRVRGHPVVIVTTATSTPSDEIRNRFNIVNLDESEEQTKRARKNYKEDYLNEIKDFIKNLKMYEVEIPDELFKFIDKHFPTNKVRYRRDFPKFLDFVKAKTIFNQEIRTKHKNVLRATAEDYNSARDIYMNAYSKLSDIPLKDIPKRIIKILEQEDRSLSAREIFDYLEGYVSIQNLYPHINDLKFKEIINEIMDRGAFGKPTSKYVLSEEFRDKKPFNLPIYEGDCN